MPIEGHTCQKRGCHNTADFALHVDDTPEVFVLNDDGSQSDERITEGREFYCADHVQGVLDEGGARSLIISGA